ncbi:MAG: ABC transporter substrate-binding protein [Deltaproteobacteria bacterium]|jgi:NitT/TauT family transport system substrate-binding protein|nr:ABC transporter substrate-binding protein [Deltaproteobacteria bacterium]
MRRGAQKRLKLAIVLGVFALLFSGLTSFRALADPAKAPESAGLNPKVKIRLGLLPIADTILIRLAVREGYFAQEGLLVTLTPFQSTLEKDSAVLAGQLDGHFCEISSAMVQRSQGRPFKIIAITSHTDPKERVFGLVTKPDSLAKNLADLKGQTLGVARQTIVDYLTDVFLKRANLPLDYFDRRDIRKIPLRLQTLAAGQLEAGIFPEPLLSVAEKNGGRVILDDRDLDMPLAAVALRDDLASPKVVKAFQRALSQAVSYVNANPGETRAYMLEVGLIPASLASGWRPPTYNPVNVPYKLPDKALFDSYVAWLIRNEVWKRPGAPGDLREPPTFFESIYQDPK